MSNLLPSAAWLALLLAATSFGNACHGTPPAGAQEAAAPSLEKPNRFEAEIARFEEWDRKNTWPPNAILFVGSSTVRLWQTAEAFPDLPVINRGFGGSTIADVNHFAERIVFKYKPRTIVFYSGDNDIATRRSPDRVFADFRDFSESVAQRLPETRLVYLAIKPSILRWEMWPNMQKVNDRVKDYARTHAQMIYLDTAPTLLGPNGQPQSAFFRKDGLHMSDKGYAAWNELLRPVLHHAK